MIKSVLTTNPALKQALILTGNTFIILTAVYCAFFAVISAFSFEVDSSTLFWTWLFCAIAVSVVAMFYRVKGLLLTLIPALLLLWWNFEEIAEGAMLVLFTITDIFSVWLSIAVLFPDAIDIKEEPTMFIAAAGIGITILLAYAVCIRRSVFLTILVTAPIVFLTFVITDLQSDIIYLIIMVSVYLTVLISSAYSPDDFINRGVILFPSFAAAVILMLVGYVIAPSQNYVREHQIANLGNRLRYAASQMGEFGRFWSIIPVGSNFSWLEMRDDYVWMFNTEHVSIAGSGGREIAHQNLLEIVTDQPGTFYIRGYSMQHFDGQAWSASDYMFTQQSDEVTVTWPSVFGETDPVDNAAVMPFGADISRSMPAFTAEASAIINPGSQPVISNMVITRMGDMTPGIIYQPYYGISHIGERVLLRSEHRFLNAGEDIYRLAGELHPTVMHYGQMSGSTIFSPEVIERWQDEVFVWPNEALSAALAEYSARIERSGIYKQIDPDTAQSLRQIAFNAGIDPNAGRAQIANAVARYVKSSASYTLSPEDVPDGVDFALYFFEELQEGYCIHFATAAVLMLRSLNVPARFTSGYVVSVMPGRLNEPLVITDRNAHAWVEVFFEDIGWIYLEVTPATIYSASTGASYWDMYDEMYDYYDQFLGPEIGDDFIFDGDFEFNINQTTGPGAIGHALQQLPIYVVVAGSIVLFVIVCILVFPVRRELMHRLRKKRFEQPDTNQAIICVWRHIERLKGLEGMLPGDIEAIALKARFSQHRSTEEERAEMIAFAKRLAFEIYESRGEIKRFIMMYVWTLC